MGGKVLKNLSIQLVNVNKVFRTLRKTINALENINLEVGVGEFVGVVGPSGCGKSTIIRLINDIIKPTSGDIYVDGEKYGRVIPKETIQKMGFIFQHPNLMPWLTLRQNVELPLKILNLDTPENIENVDRLLEMVNLTDFENSMPSEMSQSMLQRAGVIRSMVPNPEILLMDEPFGSLDEMLREQLDMEFLDLWSKIGQSVVFITHNVAEAILMSDFVYVMGTNPGTILEKIKIDFPRPRTLDILEDREFVEYEEYIVNLIGDIDLSKIV